MTFPLKTVGILKGKGSDGVITDGLQFWGSSEPSLLTIDAGKITEAYDVRDGYGGSRKMVQTDTARQPILLSESLYFDSANKYLQKTSEISKTMFIVMNNVSNSPSGIGLINPGSSPNPNSLGANGGNAKYSISGVDNNFFLNATKYSAPTPDGIGYIILHSAADFNKLSNTIAVGYLFSFGGPNELYIKEWGWYNRVLTDDECLTNINFLNVKYSIF